MKMNVIQEIAKAAPLLVALTMATGAFGADTKESMCVKQKDGTYKCKASGKIMKAPCCKNPENGSKDAPKPK